MVRRVAVTGAGGFIGSATVRAFTARGVSVTALVGPSEEGLPEPAGVARAFRADITDRAAIEELVGGADAVVHLAGPPSVRASFDEPARFVRAHVEGTATVLEACRRGGVSRIVYVSSAEVYGRPQAEFVAESHELAARSPYAAAKIGCEQLVGAYGHAFEFTGAILRPFSVYGPGMGAHAVLPSILRQLESDGPVVLADLRPVRDYCFVDDVARAIALAAESSWNRIVVCNVASGVGTSVAALAHDALELGGRLKDVVEDASARRPGSADILRLVADCSRARELLAWEPRVSLRSGLVTMLDAMRATR